MRRFKVTNTRDSILGKKTARGSVPAAVAATVRQRD